MKQAQVNSGHKPRTVLPSTQSTTCWEQRSILLEFTEHSVEAFNGECSFSFWIATADVGVGSWDQTLGLSPFGYLVYGMCAQKWKRV